MPEKKSPEKGLAPQPDKLERLLATAEGGKNYYESFLDETEPGDLIHFHVPRNPKDEETYSNDYWGPVVEFDKKTKLPIIEVGKGKDKKQVLVNNLRQAFNYSWLFDRDGWKIYLEGLNPEEQAHFVRLLNKGVEEELEELFGDERRKEQGEKAAHLAERKKESKRGRRGSEDQQAKWQNLLNQEVEFKQKGKALSGKLVGYKLDSYGSIGKIEIQVEPEVGKKRDIYLVKKKDLIGPK